MKFLSVEGVLFTADKSKLIAYAKDKVQNTYTVPEGVISIDKGGFYECNYLTSITLPSTLTSIDDSCFQGCKSLTSIVIPEGVTFLGEQCFYECASLASIILPSTLTRITVYCFEKCGRLTSITAHCLTAPITYKGNPFGDRPGYYTGEFKRNTGENTLYVPAGATGYDKGYWLDPLQNAEKCGFTLSATL